MYNLDMNIRLISGDATHCDPGWVKPHSGPEHCYKLYLVTAGEGWAALDGDVHALRAGHACYLDGHRLEAHGTEDFLDVCWLHVTPESLPLAAGLQRAPAFHDWPAAEENLHLQPLREVKRLLGSNSLADACRLQSVVAAMLADVLEDLTPRPNPLAERFAPAVTFMDQHWREDPPLANIAETVGLSAEHFHRLFRQAFQTTPRAYMLARRMGLARQLLQTSDLNVAQVARRVGYTCGFHFSKAFKQYFGQSPSTMRTSRGP
jgi:AraC-like DNA-binding protein